MTNREVINFLNQVRKILLNDKSWLESTIQPINEAFDMAISALQVQDAPDTNVDTISRQAAIDALDVLCQEHRYRIPGKRETYSQYNEAWQDALDRAEGAIFNLPSAQPERKKGEWVKEYWNGEHTRKCSACNITQTVTTYRGKVNFNYCPYCGADMRGEQDE